MRVAFTGHRPEKLPWMENPTDPRVAMLADRIGRSIAWALDQGFRIFACGMARGCDLLFARCVLTFAQTHPDVRLEAWIPCPSQTGGWSAAQRSQYDALLSRCHQVYVVEPCYSPGCMIRRNRAMVDQSQLLLSVYDGSAGGTGATIDYASSRGLQVIRLWH